MPPAQTEFAPFYSTYVSLVPEADILKAMQNEHALTTAFLAAIPAIEEHICHSPYTWTIRQVVGHLIDTERVFAYRSLWFARGETTPLPGFDQGPFSVNSPHAHIPLVDLAAEFHHIRAANLCFFSQLDPVSWDRRGVASGAEITVRALAYCIVGHERHHMGIVRQRWGNPQSHDGVCQN